jgi:hypothetical protein
MVLANAKGSVVSVSFCSSALERIGLRTSGHTLKRCLGLVVAAFELGTDARLADQLHGRQKQVLEGSKFVSVRKGAPLGTGNTLLHLNRRAAPGFDRQAA